MEGATVICQPGCGHCAFQKQVRARAAAMVALGLPHPWSKPVARRMLWDTLWRHVDRITGRTPTPEGKP